METLETSGLPVAGTRGLGYAMTAPVTLPPLNLTAAELEALHLGLAVVAQSADEELQAAARALSARIDAALPEHRAAPAAGWIFAGAPLAEAARGLVHMPAIRAGLKAGRKLRIGYRALDDTRTDRVVRPLQIEYWGRLWTLTGWCELRGDFRVFRVDRIDVIEVTADGFAPEPGRTLADFLARYSGGPDGN
jgi:predicted DNA-binding transcriptional regulator YafY